jgi:Flp pilus assembly protein TadD
LKSGTSINGSHPPAAHPLVEIWREHKPIYAGIALFGLVLWTFLPAVDGEFVIYDDPQYVTENPYVQAGLTWEGLAWAFGQLHGEGTYWHPLTWMSHMLDCRLFGLEPWGHHLTNVLFHAANTVLVFLVFRSMTGAFWRCAVLATLFALHPLQVDSVAWVAERKNLLSSFFWLLTTAAYVRCAQGRRKNTAGSRQKPESGPGSEVRAPSSLSHLPPSAFYFLSLVLFAMGLMCKPVLVTLPFVLLLLDYWPLCRFELKTQHSQLKTLLSLVWEKIPFFVLAAASSVVTLMAHRALGSLEPVAKLPWDARIANVLVSYVRYLGKTFWPSRLTVFYPYPAAWAPWEVLTCGLLLLVVTALVLCMARSRPGLFVGWFWFLGVLVPFIGLVQAGEQAMADRFMYLPAIGLILATIWGLQDLTKLWRYQSLAASLAAAGAAVLCLVLTRAQIGYWKDTETLFRHALQVTEHNYVAHNNLGTALDKQGRWDEALSEFRQSLQAKPDYPEALNNLGVALDRQGHVDEAIAQLRKTLSLRPRYAVAHYNLGVALQEQGHPDEATAHYQEALRLKPRYTDAHYNLGLALQRKGDLEGAIAEFQTILKLQPNSPEACNKLGAVLEQKGQLDDAIRQYQAALRLKPDYARAHFNLGIALGRKGQTDQAVFELEQTLKLDPGYAPAQTNLTRLLDLKRSMDK